MTTRQISETLMDIYGFEASEGFISDVTDKLLPQIEEWQKRPLSDIYPVVFIDAIHYLVRDNNVIRKLAAYVILGINCKRRKEVLSIQIGKNESAKYWLSVLNELRNQGVKDILILCADGLTGIREATAAAYPQTEYQRCIVHQVRNTLKYVVDNNREAFANDLKTIYNAPSEQAVREAPDEVTAKDIGREVSPGYEALVRQLGRCQPDFQVLQGCADSDLYHQCRKSERNVPAAEQSAQCISQRHGAVEALYLSTFKATKNGRYCSVTGAGFTAS